MSHQAGVRKVLIRFILHHCLSALLFEWYVSDMLIEKTHLLLHKCLELRLY